MTRAILVLLALLCAAPAFAQVHADDFDPSDRTVESWQDGGWHSASTWDCDVVAGGQQACVPDGTEFVTIKATHDVTWTSGDITIWTLYIEEGGSLTGNFSASSNPSSWSSCADANLFCLTISDTAHTDTEQYQTGIIVRGTLTLTGKTITPYVQLAEGIAVSEATFALGATPTNWVAGQRLHIGDTRTRFNWQNGGSVFRDEWFTINSIAGATVTPTDTPDYAHPKATNADGTDFDYPYIANLSRNVIIKSEDPTGVRGHLLITDDADVDLNYVRVEDLGRTTGPDSGGGTCTLHSTTNHIGRYPVHLHGNAVAAVLNGMAIENTDITEQSIWGITIHGTNSNEVKFNVVVGWWGWGIGTELGSEQNNQIWDNYVSLTQGDGNRGDNGDACVGGPQTGRNGTGFWLTGNRNDVRRNIAISSEVDNFGLWGVAAGVCQSTGGASGVFRTNKSIGPAAQAISVWRVNTDGSIFPCLQVEDFTEWHSGRTFYGYGMRDVIVRNIQGRSDCALVKASRGNTELGFWYGDYDAQNTFIDGLNIQCKFGGLTLPYGTSGPLPGLTNANARINYANNLVFADNEYDIYDVQFSLAFDPAELPDFEFYVRATTHDTDDPSTYRIYKYWETATGGPYHFRKLRKLQVKAFDGDGDDNFRVYADAQAGAATMVADGALSSSLGCPTSMLSNTNCLSMEGFATGDEITPVTAASRTGVEGVLDAMAQCTITNTVTLGMNVWTIANDWTTNDFGSNATILNGTPDGYPSLGLVDDNGTLYSINPGGNWFRRDGGTWNVATYGPANCAPPVSANGTTFTNWPEFQGGYIFDSEQNFWVATDNQPPYAGSGIQGVLMQNGQRTGYLQQGCCTVTVPADAPAPWSASFCGGSLYTYSGSLDQYYRYVGGYVYANRFATVDESDVTAACGEAPEPPPAGRSRGLRFRIGLAVEPSPIDVFLGRDHRRASAAGHVRFDRGPVMAAEQTQDTSKESHKGVDLTMSVDRPLSRDAARVAE
jgi:hypothetical protein